MGQPGEDIAVIGVAVRFPQADDLDAFRANLRAGRDSVRPMPALRMRTTNVDPDVRHAELGYLDRIDLFDHRFFGLSRREAELIDPQHRIALHLTQGAVEDAGLAPSSLRDSRTAVVFSSPSADYGALVGETGTLAMLGTVPCALPSRVAHLFGLVGPTYGVDTGCNGSLVAVHHACRELRAGDADLALAGGVAVRSLHPPADDSGAFQAIISPQARCRAFDAAADGTAAGEGGAVLLLSTLSRARAEGLPVHAVIRGTAIGHNGHRSATISTPSALAHADVIGRAWRAAGLDLSAAGYLEAHGSGTRLGDAVEIEGLGLAGRRAGTRRAAALPIGSVKTAIGHLDHAAGVAGLVRAILSVRHGELYPSLHYRSPADGVDPEAAGVRVVTALEQWPGSGEQPRRAGVSSFSLGGIVAHCVVEQAPEPPTDDDGAARLLPISARTPDDLVRTCTRVAVALRPGSARLADVAATLGAGRDHHPVRLAVVATDTRTAATALAAEATWRRSADPEGAGAQSATDAGSTPRVVLLFSGDAEVPADATVAPLPTSLPLRGSRADTVAWQLDAHRRMVAAGVPVHGMLSSGAARYAVRWLRDELTPEDTVELTDRESFPVADPQRLRHAVAEVLHDGPVVVVELGLRGELGDALTDPAAPGGPRDVLRLPPGPDGLLRLLGALYSVGVDLDWAALADVPAGPPARRIHLPGTPLRGERCWPLPLGEIISLGPTAASEPDLDHARSEADEPTGTAGPPSTVAAPAEAAVVPAAAEPPPIPDPVIPVPADTAEPDAGRSATAGRAATAEHGTTVAAHHTGTTSTAAEPASAQPVSPAEPATTGEPTGPPVGPWLREALRALLHADDVPADADYFALGGNSVIALQLIDRVAETYDVSLGLIDIYDHPRVHDLASVIAERAGTVDPEPADPGPDTPGPQGPDPAEPEVAGPEAAVPGATAPAARSTTRGLPPIVPGDDLVVSFGQERMWFHHQLDPGTTLYNLPAPARVRGPLDAEALRLAWEDLAARHEVLRSNFVTDDGRPRLVIRPALGDFFTVVDVSDAADPEAAAREILHTEQRHVFDIAADPLVRVVLVRLAPDDHLSITLMHHAVNDGWAPAVLSAELAGHLAARTRGERQELPALPIQFRDYARWQRELLTGPALDAELDYWRRKLQDPPVLDLPTDHPRPARRDHSGDHHSFIVPEQVTEALRELGRAETATLFTVVLSGLYVLLGHYSGQDDVVVGTPTIGRTRPELWQLIGFFNNTIALRADLSGEPTFRDLVRQVRGTVLTGLEHQEVPFDRVVKAVAGPRDPSRSPLFDVMYVHQTLPPTVSRDIGRGNVLGGGDREDPFPGLPPGTAKFDLSLVLGEHAEMRDLVGILEYSTQLFAHSTVVGMAELFLALLRTLAAAPDRPVREVAAAVAAARPGSPAPVVEEPGSGADVAYWRQLLDHAPVVELPTDRPRPTGGDTATAAHRFGVPADVVAAAGGDPVTALLGAYLAVVAARAGTDDVVVGAALDAGQGSRPAAIRVDLSDEPAWGDLLARVDATLAGARRHLGVPVDVLARALDLPPLPGRHPLFDLWFGPVDAPTVAHPYDLALTVRPDGDAVAASLTYRTALFDPDTVAALADELVGVLRAAAAEPDRAALDLWLPAVAG
ncbi:condensation domain-containing protein [Micromonospora sp. WMMD964]|uniref:condensation domain-containing protein n=1 Tax=Micromonospora sp. WMMD964 TaxID=3016091 RepID=UPI00249A8C16|nr:condensation domain-containing protein [Micromonospora sp. WMMD964]WFE98691.1 condensation domain-containing protein [Micromonospora sp. WMMD964]